MEGQGLRNLLIEVFSHMATTYRLGIGIQAAFVMATNPTYIRRTRHNKCVGTTFEIKWQKAQYGK